MKTTFFTSILFVGGLSLTKAIPAVLEERQDPAESNFHIYGGSEAIGSGSGVVYIDKNGYFSS